MVSDSRLLKISLAMSVAGVVALFVFVEFFMKPAEVPLSGIDYSLVGKEVIVQGRIYSFSASNGNYFITLADGNATIDSVLFSKQATDSIHRISEGDFVSVTGEVNNYRGALEIIIKDIGKIS